MFIGHYSAAFLARRVAPQVPLPVLFVACQLMDIFWALFVVLGVEKLRMVPGFTATNPLDLYFMPYTHSLPGALAWAVVGACVFHAWFKPRSTRAVWVVGAVVASHWLLDLVVHRPDLPLLVEDVKVGVGLWNYRMPALLLELGLLWAAVGGSLKQAGANRRRYLVLAAAMTVIQVLTIIVPMPPKGYLLALQLLFFFGVLTWGAWVVDRRRAVVAPRAA